MGHFDLKNEVLRFFIGTATRRVHLSPKYFKHPGKWQEKYIPMKKSKLER